MKTRLRLALDHNFPRTIIEVVMQLVPEAELVPLQALDDKGMLANEQTKLTAIVVAGVGHDPVRAAGLVLHKLPQVCGQHTDRRGQLRYLTSGPVDPRDIRGELEGVARRHRTTADKLVTEHRLTRRQLDSDPLEQLGVGERGA